MNVRITVVIFLIGLSTSLSASDRDAFLIRVQVNKGVKQITEITRDWWTVTTYFDENGYLLREVNRHKADVRSEYEYGYSVSDSLLEVRTKRVDANTPTGDDHRIEKYYYNSDGRCMKFEVLLPTLGIPILQGYDFTYEDGLLASYRIEKPCYSHEIKISYQYDKERRKVLEMRVENQMDTTYYTYAYNKNDRLTDYVQMSHDKNVTYGDVVCWSDKALNKVHIRYAQFDLFGNWERSYYMTQKGKVIRSKRRIEYYTH